MSRVLLVTDAPEKRSELCRRLTQVPHTVRVASAGDLPIATARDWNPDVIVMDMTTEGAALPLRLGMMRDPELTQIPFVMIGGSEDEARALGAHAYVVDESLPELDSVCALVTRLSAMRMPLPA